MDSPVAMIVMGSALQAAPVAHRIAAQVGPRAVALVAALRARPAPATNPALDALFDDVAALD